MNILVMLWKNLWGGNRTVLFPARPKEPKDFRGLVRFDPTRCTGCATCKFRCTGGAIDFKPGKGEFTWIYDPGRCTFCGRCVDGCKANALSQDPESPPIYLTSKELFQSHTVIRKPPVRKTPAPNPPVSGGTAPDPAAGGTK
jgi:formate hydrogenlyase subunit 6/NADH:ubiquinone oxidoreductase subunit I